MEKEDIIEEIDLTISDIERDIQEGLEYADLKDVKNYLKNLKKLIKAIK